MDAEKDYVLGTHDVEIARLALQHRVWRPRVLEAWKKARFGQGQTVLDIGCGPGEASLDLAEIVGPRGKIVAIDKSKRFLDTLETRRRERSLDQIELHELDLDEGAIPSLDADGAWGRWIFSFVNHPRDLVRQVHRAMRAGGVFACHEYFDYGTWRLAPHSPKLEEFVEAVKKSWRANGGEPDIALNLMAWLEEAGFEILSLTPIVDVLTPDDALWEWPKVFLETGAARLVELGHLSNERADAIVSAFHAAERAPHTRMITPGVLEIVARRI